MKQQMNIKKLPVSKIKYGIYENGRDGRLLFVRRGRLATKRRRASYIEQLIDMGNFRPSDRQMLRETLEILPLESNDEKPVFKKGLSALY